MKTLRYGTKAYAKWISIDTSSYEVVKHKFNLVFAVFYWRVKKKKCFEKFAFNAQIKLK